MQPVGKWRVEEPVQEAPAIPVGKWSVVDTVVDTRDTETFQAHMMLDEAIAREEGGVEELEVLSAVGKKTSEGRPIYKNQWGDFVTERTITEFIPELGGVYNIPTVLDGKFLSPEEAIQSVIDSKGKDPVTGRDLIQFNSIDKAVKAAEERSGGKLSEEMEGVPQFDQAMFWADKYNADVSVPIEERVEAFNKKQSVDVLPSVTKAVKSAVSSGAFVAEMESRGLSEDIVVAALENISKVETNGGRNNTISTGGAGGILQVIPSTFDDLLSRDVVGPKALESIGKTKEELLALSDEEKGNYLKGDDKAAAIFGLAAFLNKMERQ